METIIDVAANLLNCEEWDPPKTFTPIVTDIPADRDLPEHIPFSQSLPAVVNHMTSDRGSCDVYLDDGIGASLGLPGNRDRARGAITLAIHVIGRPLAAVEVVPRNYLISISKLAAEAALADNLIMAG